MDRPSGSKISKHQVVQRGQYLLESGEMSDCKFIVGQEPQQQVLVGHKLLLAMSSPVFKAMFYGSMAENTNLIPIPDVQPETFKSLLKYIYTDKVDLVSFESVCELCLCADKYMLQHLVQECTKYLCCNLTSNIVCKTYEFAKLLNEPTLMDKCLNLICTQTTEVLDEPNWEKVELDTLLTIFDKNNLQIKSEIKLFIAVERWAKAECIRKSLNPLDTECLRSVIGDALSKIRFLTLTSKQFAEGINGSLLLTKDEAFAIFMNVSLSNCNTPMPEGFSTNISFRIEENQWPNYHPYSRCIYYASDSDS